MTALGAVDGLRRGSVELARYGSGKRGQSICAGWHGEADQRQLRHSLRARIDGLNATTRLHITPDEIALPGLVARPRQGGIVNADIRYLNWSSPDNLPPSDPQAAGHGHTRPGARRAPEHRIAERRRPRISGLWLRYLGRRAGEHRLDGLRGRPHRSSQARDECSGVGCRGPGSAQRHVWTPSTSSAEAGSRSISWRRIVWRPP